METGGNKPGGSADNGEGLDCREIVMGLHWDPGEPAEGEQSEPANLDALCMALDAGGRVLETVHPHHTRNTNGSIVHTGDSSTGAGSWDDERIFVFLEALPAAVAALEFAVWSANGRALGQVAGASCHFEDRLSEHEWFRLDLAALGAHRACRVAMLRRRPAGWRIAVDPMPLDWHNLARLVASSGSPAIR